jgi:hypothetical protein
MIGSRYFWNLMDYKIFSAPPAYCCERPANSSPEADETVFCYATLLLQREPPGVLVSRNVNGLWQIEP